MSIPATTTPRPSAAGLTAATDSSDGVPVRLVTVSGGMGEPSLTGRLARRLADAAAARLTDHDLTVDLHEVPLRPLAVPVAQAQVGTARRPQLEQALQTVLEAEALVFAGPTYKAGLAGVPRAFWELVEDGALAGVPTVLGATGGTARHSLVLDTSLRPLFAQLGAQVLPKAVFAATDDWGGGPASADGTAALARRIESAGRALGEAVLRSRAAAGMMVRTPAAPAVTAPDRRPTASPAAHTGPATEAADTGAPSPEVTPFAAILGRR